MFDVCYVLEETRSDASFKIYIDVPKPRKIYTVISHLSIGTVIKGRSEWG